MIKYFIIALTIALMGMGWRPEKPPEQPIEKPVKLLTEYYWGTSDEVVPGKAVLMPHTSLTSRIIGAQVNDENLQFVMVYRNGQEIWAASNDAEFYGKANLTVETHDSVYKTIISEVEPEKPAPPVVGPGVESLMYRGRVNGDRPTWYGKYKFAEYQSPLHVSIEGCLDIVVVHNGVRYESGGLILKQSDVPGRGMAVVYSSSCKSTVAKVWAE